MLLPGDQIHKINSEDVRDAPRSRVIELVRSADQELVLTISQPPSISVSNTSKVCMQWSSVLLQLDFRGKLSCEDLCCPICDEYNLSALLLSVVSKQSYI